MLYMVTGGCGSGKSEFAEELAVKVHSDKYLCGRLLYVASMYPYTEENEGTYKDGCNESGRKADEEIFDKIRRHRKLRSGKGFETIECYTHLESLNPGREDVLLFECMSNLLANEMFLDEGRLKLPEEENKYAAERFIVSPLLSIAEAAGAVIVVTNEIFSDGSAGGCDVKTKEYIKLLAYINKRLAREAFGVVEAVCSIPLWIKGEEYA